MLFENAQGASNVMELFAADSVASYDVELLSGTPEEMPSLIWDGDGSSLRSPFPASVTIQRELHTPSSERSCLHVELDLHGSKVGTLPLYTVKYYCIGVLLN